MNKQPPSPKIALETEPAQKIGQEFHILATAIVSQGNRTLAGQTIQFFCAGQPNGNPAQTDENGRVQYNITGIPLGAKNVSIEVQIVGQPIWARKIISLPTDEKPKQVPTELIVDPTRVGNQVNIFVYIINEDNQGVPNAKITIVDSSKDEIIRERTDEDGDYLYQFVLEPDEEKEIAIYAAGYGDCGYRQTFRGRRL